MFCSKCGAPNDDQARFCQACGTNLKAITPGPPTQTQPVFTPNVKKESGLHKVVGILMWVFIGFAILVALVSRGSC